MLVVGAAIIGALALVPGLPVVPFILVATVLGTAAYAVWKMDSEPVIEDVIPVSMEPETPQDMLEMVVIDPMEIEAGYGIIPLIDEDRTDNLLRQRHLDPPSDYAGTRPGFAHRPDP